MTTLEEKKENTAVEGNNLRSAMPARAKYYFNSEGMTKVQPSKDLSSRYSDAEVKSTKSSLRGISDLYIDDEDLRKDIQNGNPDLLPTGTTLKMLQSNHKAPSKPFESDESVSYKVNSKGKFLFAVYAVLVLSLILIIVFNALAIERQKAENVDLNSQLIFAAAKIDDLSLQADNLTVSTYILEQAQNYGMVQKQAQTVRLNLPQIVEKADTATHTNWFDWVCDIIS